MMLSPPLQKAPRQSAMTNVTPLTPNMKTGGMWFTFPQLAGGANVTFLNPSLGPRHWGWEFPMTTWLQNPKGMDGTDKVAEWKLLLLVQQHREEGIYFVFRSGEEDKRIGCSQDKGGRIQSIAYSQPAKSGKEGVDCVSKFRMLIMVTVSHFIKIQKKARWLFGITQDFCFRVIVVWCWIRRESLKKIIRPQQTRTCTSHSK